MTKSAQKGRGRPKLDAADALRARACWRWVHAATGLSLTDWECRLYPESVVTDAKIERPRIWDRYDAGTMCPKDDGTETCTVGRVDSILPGFRAFHGHPFWRTIGSKALSQDDAVALMRELVGLREWLFQTTPIVRFGVSLGPYDPPLRRAFDDGVFHALTSNPTLDSAAAFLAMVHEADGLGSQDFRDRAMGGYRTHVPMLRKHPAFSGIVDALTDLIDKRIGDYVIIHGNQKFRIHIFTKNLTEEELLRGYTGAPAT
ncbi:hypothetical protein [Sinimarinibacterium thermocellulolyticum]|uniref:Amidohydrolase family protein n=1 Tax=Sinimarinibacterium thermocellulolyticum TaxID=3170016 RepID=A0ABV2AEG3_9GAMM